MNNVDRYIKYQQEPFDEVILSIRKGQIKAGRYAHKIKLSKDFKIGNTLFKECDNDGNKRK